MAGEDDGCRLVGYNETDIREEIAAPLLDFLGYKKGTSADILREHMLKYDYVFLGRKKKNDPPLRGRADYVLAVNGGGRWVLEIKAPNEKIGIDEIEQGLSYARHPEISGAYAAVTNGLEFVLYSVFSRASEPPLFRIKIDSPEQLAREISGILSPSAIARDCSPTVVDLGMPLADGLRSRSIISGGKIVYEEWG